MPASASTEANTVVAPIAILFILLDLVILILVKPSHRERCQGWCGYRFPVPFGREPERPLVVKRGQRNGECVTRMRDDGIDQESRGLPVV